MVWLALIALTVWLVIQQNSLGEFKRELAALRQRLAEPVKPQPVVTDGITPAMQAAARVAAEAVMASPGTVTEQAEPAAPTPEPQPVQMVEFTPPPRPPPPAPAPTLTRAAFERWVAEKGLAWIGGSALVIGGGFLVGYAAQRGFFTPRMRIVAAAALGLALLVAGELIRRRRLGGFGGHQLAAAIVSGAGAAVLYGTTWAAYDLYGYINGAVCAGLLAAIAWGLLGLAFLHGEALAVLALGGAFIVPLVSGAATWSTEALSLYLGILIAGGAATGWLRRWSVALWTNLAGAAVWALLGCVEQESLKALLLGVAPLAAMTALAYARPRELRGAVGAGAVIVASASACLALTIAYIHGPGVGEGVIAALALPVLTAALQRRGQAPAWALAAPGVAFTLAAAAARLDQQQSLTLTMLWCLQVLMLDAASLWAVWRAQNRGATGVGALSSLALALELWGGASAAALLATIALGLSWRWAGLGFGAATLGLALLGRRLNWRSIAASAAAGGGLGLASLLTPAMLGHALGHGWDAGFYLGVAILLALASFVAARIVVRDTGAAEALRTLSPLAALVGAFVFLRWVAGGGGAHLDGLTEASIRTFLIADAGLASLARLPTEHNPFARWRGHLLMAAAAAHGLFFQALLFNPRLGIFGDLVSGPPLFDSLAIAFAAPAVVFGAAAARLYRHQRPAARIYAVVALLTALSWAFLEIRRLAHGPHLGGDGMTVGALESLGCSLVLLGVAALAVRLRPAGEAPAHPLRHDLQPLISLFRWIAIVFTIVMAGLWSNPCWGVADRAVGGWGAEAAILGGYALVLAAIALLALDADRSGAVRQAELAADAAIAMGLIFAGLMVRAAFHGTQLTLSTGTSELETWSYSGVGAIMGLAFVGFSRAGGRLFLRAGLALLLLTTLKVFIVDTASLSGVVRAGSFLALGVLLLLGALTARRILGAPSQAR